MSKQTKAIERLIEELLKYHREMSTDRIVDHIIMDIGDGNIEDLIRRVIESMADRMQIIETPRGKWRLNT